MSRIGKAPIVFDPAVKVETLAGNVIRVKGAKSHIDVAMQPSITAKIEGNKVTLTTANDEKETRALHGLYRALIYNAVVGVTKGFTKSLELQGVGYRASVSGKKLDLSLGFSHPIAFDIPEGLEIKVEKQTSISITGASKELVGQVAAKIRSFRPPEPYLGKGVRYTGEHIRKKAGKSAGK